MVNPDVRRVLDLDKILALGRVMEVQVLKNHVRHLLDAEATARQARTGPRSKNRGTADQVND